MNRQLHKLNRRIITFLELKPGGSRHLRQAKGARVRVLSGPDDLEWADHGETHVLRPAVGTVVADAEVNVDEGCRMALKPAWLERDGAACCGPVGAVLGESETAAYI